MRRRKPAIGNSSEVNKMRRSINFSPPHRIKTIYEKTKDIEYTEEHRSNSKDKTYL